MSDFSDFIRHASPEERQKVMERVLEDANAAQYRELVQTTEACARHHQERADALLTESSNLQGLLSEALKEWYAWMADCDEGVFTRPCDNDWDTYHRIDAQLNAVSGRQK